MKDDKIIKFEADTLGISWDEPHEATLGISISEYDGCYATLHMDDGSMRRVKNLEYVHDSDCRRKYLFRGCGDLQNTGTAGSRLALILKDIRQMAEVEYDVEIKNVCITCMNEACFDTNSIQYWQKREAELEREGKTKEQSPDFIAYQEFGQTGDSLKEIVTHAAHLARLPQTKVVPFVNSLMLSFEKYDEAGGLLAGETGIIYELSGNKVQFILFTKKEDEGYEMIACESKCGPLAENYYAVSDDGENNARLKDVLGNTIEDLESCYIPLLQCNYEFLQRFMEKNGYQEADIDKIYLVGSEWEYPFTRKYIGQHNSSKICSVSPFECIAAVGASLNL